LGLGEKEFSSKKAKKAETIVLESASKLPFVLESIQTKEGTKTPSAPFTTSTLQQTASRMFGR
jgi:DNA topoisomerase IA